MPVQPTIHFYFDYVDPASYLVELRIRELLSAGGTIVLERHPFELRPPPSPRLSPEDPDWRRCWKRLEEDAPALGAQPQAPWIVPWSRKAHELALHARTKSCLQEIHDAIFRGYFEEGRDIGRVDVLVTIAEEGGLDRMEAKAVLDVDRYRDEVEAERTRGLKAEVRSPPVLELNGSFLDGVPTMESLESFLALRGSNDNT